MTKCTMLVCTNFVCVTAQILTFYSLKTLKGSVLIIIYYQGGKFPIFFSTYSQRSEFPQKLYKIEKFSAPLSFLQILSLRGTTPNPKIEKTVVQSLC